MSEADAECRPLGSLDELLLWQKDAQDWSTLVTQRMSRSDHCYAGADLRCPEQGRRPAKRLRSSCPKTLICHDMEGGYLDDRFVHGAPYDSQYLFYHWSVVDVFVYFSHNFVTIPPLMWINAARNHGVRILGTIITEHVEGRRMWSEILRDQNTRDRVVDQLVAIRRHYRFDGYLLNIENGIEPALLQRLADFLRRLKSKMDDDGTLIWYDAVSFVHGKLRWQNELNEHNEPAFEICDGIFLNYWWQEAHLRRSLRKAGVRAHDVYVGADVFGRGTSGRGGFETDRALSTIRSFDFSAAIFGPGWTYERRPEDREFFAVENEFWSNLFPYLYVHCPNAAPFHTDFNLGVGFNPQRAEELWYDLSRQSFHAILPSCVDAEREGKSIRFEHSLNDSVVRGGFLLKYFTENETKVRQLMMCDFHASEKDPLRFSISAKPVGEFRHFKILLYAENVNRNFLVSLNVGPENEYHADEFEHDDSLFLAKQINSTKIASTTSNGWIRNDFQLKFEGIISQIDVTMGQSTRIGRLSFEKHSSIC